ncbi:MAG: hypothetical protein U0931_39815 [Vulcanimicrobiota bacterium]
MHPHQNEGPESWSEDDLDRAILLFQPLATPDMARDLDSVEKLLLRLIRVAQELRPREA